MGSEKVCARCGTKKGCDEYSKDGGGNEYRMCTECMEILKAISKNLKRSFGRPPKKVDVIEPKKLAAIVADGFSKEEGLSPDVMSEITSVADEALKTADCGLSCADEMSIQRVSNGYVMTIGDEIWVGMSGDFVDVVSVLMGRLKAIGVRG